MKTENNFKNNPITSDELKAFRHDFKKAVKNLEEKYGYKFNLGNIKYLDYSFTAKLEVNKSDSVKSAEELKFEQYCGLFNLKPSHFGVPLKCNGKEYKLIGLNLKAPKYSVIGIDSEGKIYKFQDIVLEQIIFRSKRINIRSFKKI